MKKSIVAAICLIGGFAVNAQTNGKDAPVSNTPTTLATPVEISQDDVEEMQKKSAPERAEMRTRRIDKWCVLTAEQRPKVLQINTDIAKKMIEAETAAGADKKGLGQKRKALEEERTNQLATVLNPEQLARYKQNREGKQAKKQEMKKGNVEKEKGKKSREETKEEQKK